MSTGKAPQSRTIVKKSPRKAAPTSAAPARARRKPASQAPDVAAAGDARAAPTVPTPEERRVLVARIAYFRAEARGFAPGYELADWYAAEAEFDQQFAPSR